MEVFFLIGGDIQRGLRVDLELETSLDEAGQACHDPVAGLFAADIDVAVSCPAEFHRQALAELCVRLSASHSSHCSAIPLQQSPVCKQQWLASRDARHPLLCSPPVPSEGLELPMRPSCQYTIDVA